MSMEWKYQLIFKPQNPKKKYNVELFVKYCLCDEGLRGNKFEKSQEKKKLFKKNSPQKTPMFTVSCHRHPRKFIENKTKTHFFDIATER